MWGNKRVGEIPEILAKTIDMDVLVKKHPELFDFKKLDKEEKVALINHQPKFFFDKIYPLVDNVSEKVYFMTHLKSVYRKKIELTDDEIKSVPLSSYPSLLKVDFEKYIRVEKFNALGKMVQGKIFVNQPEWVLTNASDPPKLTRETLDTLSAKNPAFIEKYVMSNIEKYSLSEFFWTRMIKYNSKYEDVFLHNTDLCCSKTDVRAVFWSHPLLVKKVTKEMLLDSKLTCKEWILLVDQILKACSKQFTGWEFSDELKDTIRLDLTAEMLTGKSKLSKRFQNAMRMTLDDRSGTTTSTDIEIQT